MIDYYYCSFGAFEVVLVARWRFLAERAGKLEISVQALLLIRLNLLKMVLFLRRNGVLVT